MILVLSVQSMVPYLFNLKLQPNTLRVNAFSKYSCVDRVRKHTSTLPAYSLVFCLHRITNLCDSETKLKVLDIRLLIDRGVFINFSIMPPLLPVLVGTTFSL